MQGMRLSRFESVEPDEQARRFEQRRLSHLFWAKFREVCRPNDNRVVHTVQFIVHTAFRNGTSFETRATGSIPT